MSNLLNFLHMKEGSLHWWLQRISAVLMIPLFLWLDFSIYFLLIVILLYHIRAGIETVIEDYVHNESIKIPCYVFLRIFIIYVLKLAAVLFIL